MAETIIAPDVSAVSEDTLGDYVSESSSSCPGSPTVPLNDSTFFENDFTIELLQKQLISAHETLDKFLSRTELATSDSFVLIYKLLDMTETFIKFLGSRTADIQNILDPVSFAKVLASNLPTLDQISSVVQTGVTSTPHDALSTPLVGSLTAQGQLLQQSLQPLERKLDDLEKLIKESHLQVTALNNDLVAFKNNEAPRFLQENSNVIFDKSYAQVTKSTPSQDPISLPMHSLRVKRTDEGEAKELLPLISSKVNPAHLQVEKTITLPNGEIILKSKNPSALNHIQQALELDEESRQKVKCFRTRYRSPRIIIYNVDSKLSADDVQKGIIAQNHLFTIDNFRVNFKISSKFNNHWVLTLVPSLFKVFKKDPTIFLGFTRLRNEEFLSVRQCSNCLRFGHVSHNCKATPSCLHCHGSHESSSCSPLKNTCINCVEHNQRLNSKFSIDHSSKAKDCPTRKRLLNKLIRTIDYGN